MPESPSLRRRLVASSLILAAGLLALGIIAALLLMHGFPRRVFAIHNISIAVVSLGLFGIGVAMARAALASLSALRSSVADVRAGRAARVSGDYPAEVQPLVDELNDLLAQRDRVIERALSRAADLAHGLKTPLAVLQAEADRASARGSSELADTLHEEIARMRRQVNYHLARARSVASGATAGVHCVVLESADGIVRALRRIHSGRGVAIDLAIPSGHVAAVQREDLDEILGNLADNACKWARSVVRISSVEAAGALTLRVDDDGPGIDEGRREDVLRRGVRADDGPAGSGMGLAIVRELVDAYGGSIALTRSDAGGLSAVVTLPAPDA